MKGIRKLLLGLYYLSGIFVLTGLLIVKGHSPVDWMAWGAYCAGVSTGVIAIVWGNAKEHQAANGKQ